jgi:hypothetical protein
MKTGREERGHLGRGGVYPSFPNKIDIKNINKI